jgi:hypothetical protein
LAAIDPQLGSGTPSGRRGFTQQPGTIKQAVTRVHCDGADLPLVLQTRSLNPALRRIGRERRETVIDAFATWFLRINPGPEPTGAMRTGVPLLETRYFCWSVAMARSAG